MATKGITYETVARAIQDGLREYRSRHHNEPITATGEGLTGALAAVQAEVKAVETRIGAMEKRVDEGLGAVRADLKAVGDRVGSVRAELSALRVDQRRLREQPGVNRVENQLRLYGLFDQWSLQAAHRVPL